MTPARGRAFWLELHGYAEAYPWAGRQADQRAAEVWFADFAKRLRTAAGDTCPCADEWDAMVEQVPPPLTGRAELVAWAIAAHDRVNKRLGRPLWRKRSALHPLLRPRRLGKGAAAAEEGAETGPRGRVRGGAGKVVRTSVVRTVTGSGTCCGGGA